MKLLSLFVLSWVTIFINVHSVIDSIVDSTKPRFCSSGQHFIFLHSQQVLHTIMSTEGRTTFNERRLKKSPLKLSLLEDACVLTEVSNDDLPAPHRERGRPITHQCAYWCTCLVEASLVTLFVVHLAYFFIWMFQT